MSRYTRWVSYGGLGRYAVTRSMVGERRSKRSFRRWRRQREKQEIREMPPEPPVRSCCGQPHDDIPCPDGKVMCCLCFDRFDIADLNEPTPGYPEDVCKPCAEVERRQLPPEGWRADCPHCGMTSAGCMTRMEMGYLACCPDCYVDDDAHRGEYVAGGTDSAAGT